MEQFGQRPVWSMSGSEMLTTLDGVQAQLDRLQTYRLELLAAFDANGHAAEIGARDTVQLISTRHRLDHTDVRRDLRLALALPKYEQVRAALSRLDDPAPLLPGQTAPNAPAGLHPDQADPAQLHPAQADPAPLHPGQSVPDAPAGLRPDQADPAQQLHPGQAFPARLHPGQAFPARLHPGQADAIVTALERIPARAQVPVDDLEVAERELIKSAQVLCPADLRVLGKRVRDTLDTDGIEPKEAQALAAENLWLKRGDLGVEFGGYLAGAHAELLQTLVFAGAKPRKTFDGRRDPRSRGRRQADALTAVLESAAATGTAVPAHGAIKPHVTVTIGLDALTTGTGTASLASGATLSAATVRRLACDAGVIPMVLGTASEPLDVGAEHRFVTPAIRRALNVRDQGCIVCAAPPAMCEAHHVVHWADGGETRLTNLALLCKRHHIDVHQGHWTLTTNSGRPTTNRPPWTSPPRSTTHLPTTPAHPTTHSPTTPAHPTTHSPTTPAHPTTHSPTTPAHPTTHSPASPVHPTAHSPSTPAATPPSRPPPPVPNPTPS